MEDFLMVEGMSQHASGVILGGVGGDDRLLMRAGHCQCPDCYFHHGLLSDMEVRLCDRAGNSKLSQHPFHETLQVVALHGDGFPRLACCEVAEVSIVAHGASSMPFLRRPDAGCRCQPSGSPTPFHASSAANAEA